MTTGEAMNTTSDFADFSSIQVKKINRKHVVVGEFVFKNGLSNDQDCTLLLFKKQGGEYRKTSFKLPIKGCCDFYNTDTYIIPEIQARCPKCPKQSDNVCPIPAVSFNFFLMNEKSMNYEFILI